VENNFLKMNASIQQQLVFQLQTEMEALRGMMQREAAEAEVQCRGEME
jgi:ketopantoate reductase